MLYIPVVYMYIFGQVGVGPTCVKLGAQIRECRVVAQLQQECFSNAFRPKFTLWLSFWGGDTSGESGELHLFRHRGAGQVGFFSYCECLCIVESAQCFRLLALLAGNWRACRRDIAHLVRNLASS